MIKMIFTDLDGTLLNNQNQVSDRNKEAIRAARKAGIMFGIATGRPLAAIKQLIKYWEIEDLIDCLVCCNGAELVDMKNHQETFSYPLSAATQHQIADAFQKENVNLMIYDNGRLVVQQEDAVSERLSRNNHMPRVLFEKTVLDREHAKLLITADTDQMTRIEEILKQLRLPNLHGIKSQPDLMEVFDDRNSKSQGIEQLAISHGYSLKETAAFGDQDNDLDMLKRCGLGIAMKNASLNAQQAADDLTLSNLEDGVADYIEKHLLPFVYND